MRLRNVKNANEIVANSEYVIKNPTELKGNIKSVFNNSNPIHLEIGCGKGKFIIDMALKYPNINFIGVEKYESVLVRAIQKLDNTEVKNLKFVRMDAIDIDEVFSNEINTLYLNFSDPWPKAKHAKRRLTSPVFLKKYDLIFNGLPHIVQKTDNIYLFGYSLASLSKHGYTLNDVSLDLESTEITNVLTEYESKFMASGVKINYLDAVKYEKK